ncbi:MAG: putative CRISPR-associated protein [Deltaproteobacteria bacterium]|jgi:putative CRISPR-associated protein (TIGR02619 family)|nr:putative CRISPR-associated protein [Deltaproteobacteria bacterium]MDX9761308.1 putative CRISPR-associated protein [Desulfomonilia bacterium]
MTRTIISTVGTSLIKNAAQKIGADKARNKVGLIRYLQDEPQEKASAETNALSRVVQQDDRLVFLHSHTVDGLICAQALCAYYQKASHECEAIEIQNLTYTETSFKMRGLRSLVAEMINNINKERALKREVLINATGGFKAEIAYATLVGLLFDVPVYYIHEAFTDIIEMPPTPISWDMNLLADHEEFFVWINKDLQKASMVEKRLAGLPEKIRLLLCEEDGFCMLSPAGEVMWRAYGKHLAELPEGTVFLSAAARRTLAQAPTSTQEVMRATLHKLASPTLRRGGSCQTSPSGCMIYPRGNRPIRVFYYELDDKARVCELASHIDGSYERLLKKGVKRSNYKNFEPYYDA